MKFLNLEFSAIGPYPRKQAVDFSDMEGLTLVCGNTGAGKTFIFDAVTFALYGESSGGDRKPGSMRCTFADPADESYVKLVFEHNGHIYTLQRWPAQTWVLKRGTGTTDKPEQVEFQLPDGRTLGKLRAVESEIVGITGLKADQWGQVVMLAQGKFRDFIDAKSEKRGEILETIFGIDVYSRLEDALGELSRDAVKKVEEAGSNLAGFAGGLALDDSPESKEFQEIFKESKTAVNKGDRIRLLMDAICAHDSERTAAAEAEYKESEQRAREAESAYNAARALHEAFAAFAAERKASEELEALKPEYEQRRESNDRARAVLINVRPAEMAFSEAEKALVDARNAVVSAEKEKEESSARMAAAAAAFAEAEAGTQSMEEYKSRSAKLSGLLSKYDEADSKKKELEAAAALLSEKEKKVEAETSRHAALEEKVGKDREILIRTENSKDQLSGKKRELEDLNARMSAASSLITSLNTYSAAKAAREKAAGKHVEAVAEWKETDQRRSQMSIAFINGQAGILAETLEDNIPCPVCGSTSHPHPAPKVEGCPTQEDIDRMDAEWTEMQGRADAAKNALADADLRLQDARRTVEANMEKSGASVDMDSDRAVDTVVAVKSAMADEKKSLTDGIAVLTSECALRDRINAELEGRDPTEESQRMLDAAKSEAAVQTAAVAALKGEYDNISKDLQFASKADLQAHIDALDADAKRIGDAIEASRAAKSEADKRFSAAAATLESASAAVGAAEEKASACRAAFTEAVTAQGFGNVDEYRLSVRSEEEVAAEAKAVGDFFGKLQTQAGKLDKAREAIEGKTDPENLEELKSTSEECSADREGKNNAWGATVSRQKDNKSKADQIRDRLDFISSTMSQMLEIKDLADVASGKKKDENGLHMSFSDYVRSKYFDSILSRAEKRLLYMTGNRYTLRRARDVSSGGNSHMLELEVLDRDSPDAPARPISSLSGGESFKAALALALGFSDAIQENAAGQRIDALFIDEGFGTLDDEALDQALDILEDLSGGKKSVCIISHVAKLRERIPRQIIVDYENGRGSKMTVVKD